MIVRLRSGCIAQPTEKQDINSGVYIVFLPATALNWFPLIRGTDISSNSLLELFPMVTPYPLFLQNL